MRADPRSCETAFDSPPDSPGPVSSFTLYERVTAMLLSLLLIAGGLTLALGAIWWTNRLPHAAGAARVVQAIEIDFGADWGGTTDGGPGESWNNPAPLGDEPSAGGDAADFAGHEFSRTLTAVLDEVDAAVDISETLRPGSDLESSGLPAGSRGTDRKRPLGDGPGSVRGVPVNRRWEITFERGSTVSEYAQQLDFLQVELAVIVDGKLYKVSQFTAPKRNVRAIDPGSVRRDLIFVWRDENRRQVDLSLIRQALNGNVPDNAVIMHCYPSTTVQRLSELERAHALAHGRRSLHDVAKTKFAVRRSAKGYEFDITQQRYLASRE
jgi:hypothetical protein